MERLEGIIKVFKAKKTGDPRTGTIGLSDGGRFVFSEQDLMDGAESEKKLKKKAPVTFELDEHNRVRNVRHRKISVKVELPPEIPPYDFIPVTIKRAVADTPIYHHHNSDLSGALQCSLSALTPLLAANDQYTVEQSNTPVPVDSPKKSILEPLRLQDGRVVIAGSAIKGMLRQSLGALLSAPMERVAEQKFSYRPNIDLTQNQLYRQTPALVIQPPDRDGKGMKVKFIKVSKKSPIFHRKKPTPSNGQRIAHYYGGIDGEGYLAQLDSKQQTVKCWATIEENSIGEELTIPPAVLDHYRRTLEELSDIEQGHISSRHPFVKKEHQPWLHQQLSTLADRVLRPDVLIYLEYEQPQQNKTQQNKTQQNKKRVTSLGHHFYYRSAYQDTVRTHRSAHSSQVREILRPTPAERKGEALTAARLLFGYTAGGEQPDPGVEGIQPTGLAGRIAINMALELLPEGVVGEDESRFLREGQDIMLKPLGQPRPSAVEHYLQQESRQLRKRSDGGTLVTYGDLPGQPGGELRGRKFYRHQPDARTDRACYATDDPQQIEGEQASIARFVSKPDSSYRFTLRFRNLREWELGTLLLLLQPERFINGLELLERHLEGGNVLTEIREYLQEITHHPATEQPAFAHKLGHGRPLGLGSVTIGVDHCTIQQHISGDHTITPCTQQQEQQWIAAAIEKLAPTLNETLLPWLKIHQYRGKGRAHYPEKNGDIFAWHADQRKRHAHGRRQKRQKRTPPQ